ncbi:MAG: hypothetical protein ABJH45_02505 [Paracoccaceae bacterium]
MNYAILRKLGLIFAVSVPAAAVALTAEEMDTNGDGLLTIDEVQALYPDLNSDSFTAMDLNADGALDADEVAAGQEAGIMPTSDG